MPAKNDTALAFDWEDTLYLDARFTLAGLRKELRSAELRAWSAEYFLNTEYQDESDLFPYDDWASILKVTIEFKKATPQKPIPYSKTHIDVRALKEQTDIVSIVERYTELRKSGRNFTGKCPIHNDTNPSLSVYPDKQSWHCFGACNNGGDVIAFIQAIENTDFQGAVALLANGH